MSEKLITRRSLLATSLTFPLAGTPANAQAVPSHATAALRYSDKFIALEREFFARLGIYGINLATGKSIGYREHELFPIASLFKSVAAGAVIQSNTLKNLHKVITYTLHDIIEYSPLTVRHITTGMTIAQLCEAAVSYSDNTAGNLLLRELGGPRGFTHFVRTLGDTVTRLDRQEPELNEATPNDVRDTTSAHAITITHKKLLFDNVLPAKGKKMLENWLINNVTGYAKIRASVPQGWKVGDKTGAPRYGGANDIAVVWPPQAKKPILLSIFSSKDTIDATPSSTLVAKAGALAINELAAKVRLNLDEKPIIVKTFFYNNMLTLKIQNLSGSQMQARIVNILTGNPIENILTAPWTVGERELALKLNSELIQTLAMERLAVQFIHAPSNTLRGATIIANPLPH